MEVLAQLRSDAGLREMARSLLLSEELLRLPEAVARLDNAVARLVEGQIRLEARQDRLEEGQSRLEEAVARLDNAVARLVEGQIRLEARQERLEEGLDALRREVGSLSRTLGGTAEEDALDALEHVMRLRGYQLLGTPTAVDLDGDGELDLWARVRSPKGAELSVVVEAKVRLRAREVRSFATQMADPAFLEVLVERGVPGPYLVYAFGIRVYAEAREAASAAGIGVLSSRGEDVAPRSLAA